MTKIEFDEWMEITGFSERRWMFDDVTYRNRGEMLWYKGGVDGVYIDVQSNGTVSVGEYAGAIPHIGEALFQPKHSQKVADNANEASLIVLERLGVGFLLSWLQGGTS